MGLPTESVGSLVTDTRPAANHHSEFSMVTSVQIKNFRGFDDFKVDGLAPINVIVGDNAVGKTAFLEAIWLALSGNPQKQINLRQWRGLDLRFQKGSGESVVEGMYGDIFPDPTSNEPTTIELWGRGYENRLLTIERKATVEIPVKVDESAGGNTSVLMPDERGTIIVPLKFTWRDERGTERATTIKLSKTGIVFEGTGERLPDSYLYAAQVGVSPTEAGDLYSNLLRRREVGEFRKAFLTIFEWIKDIQASADTGELLADVPWAKRLLPLPELSGGTSRAATILLAIAQRRDGLVMVDEIESGIFHARHEQFAINLLKFARLYKTQLFLTTHSDEWLKYFLRAAGDAAEDVVFWRMERIDNGPPLLSPYSVSEFRSGRAVGEMR